MTGRIDAVVAVTAASLGVEDIGAEVAEHAELSLARVPLNQSRPTRLRLAAAGCRCSTGRGRGRKSRQRVRRRAHRRVAGLDRALDGARPAHAERVLPQRRDGGQAAMDLKVTGLADSRSSMAA